MKKKKTPQLAAGDECPNCKNGTLHLGEAGEVSCAGECGAILRAARPDRTSDTGVVTIPSTIFIAMIRRLYANVGDTRIQSHRDMQFLLDATHAAIGLPRLRVPSSATETDVRRIIQNHLDIRLF